MDDLLGRYFLWQARVLYIGRGGRSALHRHHMVQVCISLREPVHVRTSRQAEYQLFRGVIVDSDHPHQVVASRRDPIVFLWIDPEDRAARRLRARFEDRLEPLIIEQPKISSLRDQLLALPLESDDCNTAHQVAESVLHTLDVTEPAVPLDERVDRVTRLIRDHRSGPLPTVDELAGSVFLSPSRLMHLFREQVGLPIRRYGLWQRLLVALQRMSEGQSITEAAHAAAFSDAAHLTRTFRAMFGVAPSELFKNSRFIQAIGCYES